MRPVKMVLRPQVCVCVIECRVAHVETRLPIFAIDIAKIGQKRPFFEKGPGRLNYVIVVVLKIEFRQHVQQDKGYLLNILF